MIDKVMMTFHEKFRQYDLGEGHPFRGDRFANAMKFFENQGLFKLSEIVLVEPQPASREELLRVHDKGYVDLIFRLATENTPYDVETPVSPEILEAALLIVGGAIRCGRAVFDGEVKRAISVGGGYHHAGRNYGGGFCIFNDVAVLVEHLRANYNVKRFLILDYDVHFGNGTSDIYYHDPSVLYISLHQDPRTIYPGTGFVEQIGEYAGEGYNINVPLPPRTSDNTYLYALNEVFVPLAEEFEPEIIIANGGNDPHFADMLGDLNLTVKGFFRISQLIRETADKVCGGKVVLIPGSGYNPQVLPMCWYALVAGVVGLKEICVEDSFPLPKEPPYCIRVVERTVDELKRLLRRYWSCFGGFGLNVVP
ncbi:MAG: histone deacetylase [Candidatus Bathyarchaeota archaeon]|nr:acetoin utilization protein AcuC [Candidatus Bathyarchaeota archaeon A05DMB-5]MDH7557994.1 histone deacetylase [Candidatus Bathyarchaeota archaeon]